MLRANLAAAATQQGPEARTSGYDGLGVLFFVSSVYVDAVEKAASAVIQSLTLFPDGLRQVPTPHNRLILDRKQKLLYNNPKDYRNNSSSGNR